MSVRKNKKGVNPMVHLSVLIILSFGILFAIGYFFVDAGSPAKDLSVKNYNFYHDGLNIVLDNTGEEDYEDTFTVWAKMGDDEERRVCSVAHEEFIEAQGSTQVMIDGCTTPVKDNYEVIEYLYVD